MRRAVVVMLLLLPLLPQGIAQGQGFAVTASGDCYGHRNESIPIVLEWNNIESSNQELQITAESHISLNVNGLPDAPITVNAQTSSGITIFVIADNDSQFGNLPLNITFDNGGGWSETISLLIEITPYSKLNFGSSSGSKFLIEQVSRINLATNITNDADFTDVVTFTLSNDLGWESGWTNSNSVSLNAGGIDLVQFWIETPPVVNSSPLAGEGSSFILRGFSSLDDAEIEWRFSVVLRDFYNVSIDGSGEDLTIDPGISGRTEVTLRNSGNIASTFDFNLIPLYESGTEVPGFVDKSIIEYNGWSVALYNAMQSTILQPGESRTIDVGFLAPVSDDSSLQVRLKIYPSGYEAVMKYVDLNVVTQQVRKAQIIIDVEECVQVSPIESCTILYQLNHQGNMYDQLKVELSDTTGISAQTSLEIWSVEIGESVRDISLNLSYLEGTIAYSNYSLNLNLLTGDGLLLDSVHIKGYIGPRIEWIYENAVSSVDQQGKLSMTMVVRNDGNTADGLIVRLSSTHFTQMSLIPPDGAIYEMSEKIRSFEMTNISIGDNFTFRAWVLLPTDQSSDGTLLANITAHSRLDDSNPLCFEAKADYLATEMKVDEGVVIIDVMSSAIQYSILIVKGWWYICGSVIIAALLIKKAAKDRRLRNEDPMAVNLGKVETETVVEEVIVNQPPQYMSREEFSQRFKSQSAIKTYETQDISEEVIRAAGTIIDHHEENLMRQKLEDLTEEISSGVKQPHAANILLDGNIKPIENIIPLKNDDDLDL